MNARDLEGPIPRILLVDDERQIHSSVRLRLGKKCRLTCCSDARDALTKLGAEEFDLCFADIHMPHMNGLEFVAEAQKADPLLGYVILSAHDNEVNLRRSISLQVYDFIPKPLPDHEGFEDRIEEWAVRTRQRRKDHQLAKKADDLTANLNTAQLEREVEIVASETARDALLEIAGLLSTVHAHFLTSLANLAPRVRLEPGLGQLQRGLDEGRKTAEAAMRIANDFFGSAYASRDSSPALLGPSLHHAAGIATRMCRAEDAQKVIDINSIDSLIALRHLSGIDFLLMLVPALGAALTMADSRTTVRVTASAISRLDTAFHDPRFRPHLWINRRSAAISQPGIRLEISASGPPFGRAEGEAWLNGQHAPLASITARGLILGLQKCKGLLGLAVAPSADRFGIVLALPV